jgi:hypothetical protein
MAQFTAFSGVGRDGMELTAHVLVEGAPSAELATLLDGVRSVTAGGEAKFSPGVQQELVHTVVGRAYGPVLLQLCHLVQVAALAPRQRIELFFWGVPAARGSAYAGWVRGRLAAASRPLVPMQADGAGVTLDYPDGRFTLAYGRMPLLVAMMEFLVSALGYAFVLERVEALLAAGGRARVGEIANDLARALYGFLIPHLPSAHESRRFQRLVEFMQQRGGGDFTRDDIDDAAILDLWLSTDEADFRVYATVLRGFLRLAEALDRAADSVGMARARSIGTDRKAGEVEPDTDTMPPPASEDETDPLLALQESPAASVKLLNGREAAEIAPVMEAGRLAGRLAQSVLRERVFGAVQARLTEALRRGGPDGVRQVLDGNAPTERYAGWVARYGVLDEHVARVMLASLHLLARAGRPEAAHLIVACAGGIDLASLGQQLKQQANMVAALRALADPAVAGPELAALMLRARRAFQSLSRAGFEPDAANRPEIVEGHAAAAASIVRLAAHLRRFYAALARSPAEVWERRFEADRAVFVARLRVLYSAAMGEEA